MKELLITLLLMLLAPPEPIPLGTFECTAYCSCSTCCGAWADGITYTGVQAVENRTIAVDPNVIPLGSVVEINGQEYVAEDIADESVRKIVIVGYSHGAALAVLCHEYVWYNRPDIRDNIVGYGFGCPRVFCGIKTKKMKQRWENFTVVKVIDDIVTHVPPFLFGFSHVGKMLTIGKKGKYSSVDAHRAENIIAELEELARR